MPNKPSEALQGFQPSYQQNAAVSGPNGEQWNYSRPQLDAASAAELAQRLGATVVPVGYETGPFTTTPQYQLQFGGQGDLYDASMIWDMFQRSPAATLFDASMRDMLKPPGPVGAGPAPSPTPQQPSGGQYGPGGRGNWGNPSQLQPAPTWPMPEIPGMPTTPAVRPHPGSGVSNPGGYTVPPFFQGFPPPIELLPGTELPRAHRRTPGVLSQFQMMGGLLGG